jgi:hypothetical protein
MPQIVDLIQDYIATTGTVITQVELKNFTIVDTEVDYNSLIEEDLIDEYELLQYCSEMSSYRYTDIERY